MDSRMEALAGRGQTLDLWRALFMSMTRLLNTVESDMKVDHDFTLVDLGILLALSHAEDAMPMGGLAARFGVDPSVITYRLKRLEARGLAVRSAGAIDRRFTFARSTEAGRSAMLDALVSMLDSADRHLISRLEPAEIPVLTRAFQRLYEAQRDALPGAIGQPPSAAKRTGKRRVVPAAESR